MKILLISNLFPPFVMGGAEMTAHSLAQWLTADGHRVHVLTSAPAVTQEKLEESTFGFTIERRFFWNVYQLYEADESNPLMKIAWHFHDHIHLRTEAITSEVITRFQPDLINTHDLQGIGYNLLRAVGRSGVPCVQVLHDFGMICINMNRFRNGHQCTRHHLPCRASARLKQSYFKTIRRLTYLSPSRALLARYRPFLVSGAQATVLPPPLYFEDPPSAPHNRALPHLLYVGQIEPWKGVAFILQVLARVAPSRRFVFDIVGGGQELSSLRSHYAGQEWVTFHGKHAPDEVGTFMADAMLLLVPSLWFENAPLVIRQAIQSGLPVLASDIGGLPELVDDEMNGRLIPAGDATAWQAAIESALHDPARIESWRSGAAEVQAARYRPEVLGPAHSELFGRVAGHAPEPAARGGLNGTG